MRHVVTGGAGFVGRYLVEAILRRGEAVLVFDARPPSWELSARCRFVQGDIRSEKDLKRMGLRRDDVIYHLAARIYGPGVPARGRDTWFGDVNVEGTRRLLVAMQQAGCNRGVFFSTDMVYGVPGQTPITTRHPRNPLGPYGRSKRDAEDLIEAARSNGLHITVFRPRFISGAGRFGILLRLFGLIRRSLPVPLIGDGSNRYQMVAVSDCADAALAAVAHGCPAGPFHLGSQDPPRVRDLLDRLIQRAGSRSRLVPTPARAVKSVLAALDWCRVPLMYPEQFLIADRDYVLDLSETRGGLSFEATRTDEEMMAAAYQEFLLTA